MSFFLNVNLFKYTYHGGAIVTVTMQGYDSYHVIKLQVRINENYINLAFIPC